MLRTGRSSRLILRMGKAGETQHKQTENERRHTVPFVFSQECVVRRGEDSIHERELRCAIR